MNHYIESIKSVYPEFLFKNYEELFHGQHNMIFMIDRHYVFRFPKTLDNKNVLKVEVASLELLNEKLSFRISKYRFINLVNL